MADLLNKLKSNTRLAMHMPGHKRNTEKFPDIADFSSVDITEIEGFDNLHHPSDILKDAMDKASEVFKSENSIFLVGGSTCGILAGICAILSDGDKVLLDRISHKSVYNAIELSGAEPIFLKGEPCDKFSIDTGITPFQVEDALRKNPDCKLVVITSPSYEGVISDIKGISEICKKFSIPLLVDSAHGSHLGFYKFPKSPQECGGDIVIESLHKTLPSLTQTAICHVTDKYYDKVMEKLSVFETSSPSYILLASIDSCVDYLKDESALSLWYDDVNELRVSLKSLNNLKLLENNGDFFDYDISKIVIFSSDPAKLEKRLRDFNIEPEMVAPDFVLCMTGAGDTKNTLNALKDALIAIDCEFTPAESSAFSYIIPHREMSAKSAKRLPCQRVSIKDAEDRISAEYVWAYPPGVPLIAPGEIISREIIELMEGYENNGVALSGSITYVPHKILVINT